jgi:hypothetical protein
MQAYDTTEWEELQQKHGNLEGHQTGRDRLRVCASAPLLVSLCSFSFSFCLPHLYLSLTHTHARTHARAHTRTRKRLREVEAAEKKALEELEEERAAQVFVESMCVRASMPATDICTDTA